MSELQFEELEQIHQTRGPGPVVDRLIESLRSEKRYHALFDALLMKKRLELGLALVRPTALKDVPDERRDEFEKVYIDSAREVGELLLNEGSIPQAWHYFRAINEPAKVAAAIEALPDGAAAPDDVVEIALFQGVAPVKGLALYLGSH